MPETIFVISDLHLGGAPGFQICSPEGQKLLAGFIGWAGQQHAAGGNVHLVLAGDIVDFLAEPEFQAFTADDRAAADKLQRIFHNYAPVWEALRGFVAQGAALTLMLGNHDIELALPSPHRLLRERLGPGRVDFIFDNQAFVAGPLIIEHGNRYDFWNVVPHDELRRMRSALSRGETPPPLAPIPGSELVCRVMNDLKRDYNFIDLLKPETQAALPLLAVLEPKALRKIGAVVELYRQARRVRFDATGTPLDAGYIGAVRQTPEDAATERLLAEARALSGDNADAGHIGAMGAAVQTLRAFKDLWYAATTRADRDRQVERLYRALRTFAAEQHLAFDTTQEDEIYLKPARHLAQRGFRVIVFGHTHLVKKVTLPDAVYLNSGTWADIIRLPDSLLQADAAVAKAELAAFADDLAHNHLANWRKPVATYVRVDLTGEPVARAEAFYFRGPENPSAPIAD